MPRNDDDGWRPSRRSFIRSGCLGAAGLTLMGLSGNGLSCSNGPAPGQPTINPAEASGAIRTDRVAGSRVVDRRDTKVFSQKGNNDDRVAQLVNRAVCALVGVANTAEAFRAIFDPTDVVAIKPNCLAGPGLSTSPAVVAAIVNGLRSIGVEHRNIYIWERTSAELDRAGYPLNRYSDTSPKCFGNDEGGFEKNLEFSGDVGSLWSSVLAGRATALVNVPVLKDHDLAGVGCGMKNMFGAIHNPNRYHDNNCDPFVADVSNHPHVRNKLRLVLADALTAQFHGGPARVLAHQWQPASILASTDPVALDRVAQKLIEEQRATHGMATLAESKRPPKWLETAAAKGLGENRLEKIELNEG